MSIKNEILIKDRLFSRFLYFHQNNNITQVKECIKVSEDLGFRKLSMRFRVLAGKDISDEEFQQLTRRNAKDH